MTAHSIGNYAWHRRPMLAALILACASFAPGASAQENALRVGGTGTTLGTMERLARAFEQANSGQRVEVMPSLGSTGGIKAVTAGAIDIGLSARPLTDEERRQGAVALEYGRSPLALTVQKLLGVTDITTQQLADIYAGKIGRWPDGSPVRLVLRPNSDISTIVLKAMSPPMSEAVTAAGKRPGMLFAFTDQEATDNINEIPGAFGLTALCEIVSANPQLKALTLDGVAPSPVAIADGSYPLYYRFYLVTGAKPAAAAERFIAFIQSESGKRILADTGHWIPSPTGTQ